MTKIGNTGPGGIRPPDPESIEDVKQKVSPKDAAPVSDSFSPRDAAADKQAGDKYAAGELKSAGDRVKTDLDSKLAPSSKDAPATKMAHEAKHVPTPPRPTFAPPYVPVGPVVMGDNIAMPGTPGSTDAQQMNLKPDQFNINDQGNLVITNQKLIDFFKSLKEKATGDINLLISNLKLPDKE
jgi:hypothetical protein